MRSFAAKFLTSLGVISILGAVYSVVYASGRDVVLLQFFGVLTARMGVQYLRVSPDCWSL